MEQTAEYLTWMRRELRLNKSHHFWSIPAVSWEERAFAEDAAGGALGGGCVWPPRSYSCSFCRREFRSAQALGGHMNVHRRDRARLKQSLCSVQEDQDQGLKQIQIQSERSICQVINNRNVSKVIKKGDDDDDDDDDDDEEEEEEEEEDDVEGSSVETGLAVGWSMNRTGLGCGSEKSFRFSKRPRITGNLNQLPPSFAPAADGSKLVQSGKGLELDLELRLAW